MIKFALVGCGAIAHKHVAAIRRIKDTSIVGIYDNNPRISKSFSNKYQIPAYGTVIEMIKNTNPTVLNILTPSGVHAKNILELVKYNKHFVVEKPLALRLDHIDEVLEKCDERGLKIFVVNQNRFNPPIQKLKEAIVQGRFGKFVMGSIRVRWTRLQSYYDEKTWRGTWVFDGGVFANQVSHHIDMLIWMLGEVESVMAKTSTRLVKIETEDTGVAILKFKNGALGVIEATTATRPNDLEGSISILGEKGSVEVGGFFMNELKIWNFLKPHPMDKNVWEKFAKVPDEYAWNHTRFYEDVVQSIDNNRKGLVDGLEGRKSVELINAIYESAETSKEIFLHFMPKICRLGVSSEK